MLESALSMDVIGKFSRYETDLSRELLRTLAELRMLQASNKCEPTRPTV